MARGSKRRRGKGWELRVYVGKGRTATRTIGDVSAKAADRQLRDFVTEVEGRHPEAGTVADLLERWLATGGRRWSPSTLAARRSWVRNWLGPCLGGYQVATFRPEFLDDLYTYAGQTLSPRSVHDLHVAAHAALAYAVDLGWRADNPAKRAHPPKVDKPDIRPPATVAVADLYLAAVDTALGVYVLLAAVTGARRGELVALQWDDVDLEAGEIVVAHSLAQPARGRPVRKSTKTDRVRRVAIDPPVVLALADHRARLEAEAGKLGRTAGSWLFSQDPLGDTPWRPDGASSRFTRLRAKVPGAEGVTLHDLRHYVATYHIASGVDPVTVAGILGHRKASMTLDVYSAFVPVKGRDAAKRITASLLPELPPVGDEG